MSTYETPIPGADIYLQSELAAKTGYQNAVARLNQQRLDTLRQSGYLADIDPTSGALSNLRVDPSNPYGTYQQLLRGSAIDAQNAHEAAAARGIGGGLAAQGETQAKYQFGQGSFQLGTGLQGALHGYDATQTGAETSMNQSILQSKMQALQAALQAQLMSQQSVGYGQAGGGDSGGTVDAPASPYGSSATPTNSTVNKPTPATYGITYGPAAGQRASANKKQGVYTIH